MDKGGELWATCPNNNMVCRLSTENGDLIGRVPVGKSPLSICTDGDGYIWALNQGSIGAARIDTSDNSVALVAPTGAFPFSATPFAACVTKKGISPSGSWNTVVDAGFDGAGWGTISWDKTGAGQIKVRVRTADDLAALTQCSYQMVMNGVTFTAANGRYLDMRVDFTGGNNVTPTLHSIHIEGTNLPPDVSQASASIPRMVGHDQKMQLVSIQGVTDPEGDPFDIIITEVTQDEPVSGSGKDSKAPDAILTGDNGVWLRNECKPGTPDKPGNGRVYVVKFKAVDSCGATSLGKVKVIVPLGPLPGDTAIDDGQKYDSTKSR
jgi:hypothetical protein